MVNQNTQIKNVHQVVTCSYNNQVVTKKTLLIRLGFYKISIKLRLWYNLIREHFGGGNERQVAIMSFRLLRSASRHQRVGSGPISKMNSEGCPMICRPIQIFQALIEGMNLSPIQGHQFLFWILQVVRCFRQCRVAGDE